MDSEGAGDPRRFGFGGLASGSPHGRVLGGVRQAFLRLPLAVKIGVAPALVAGLLMVVAAIAWQANRGLSRELHDVGGIGMERLEQAYRLQTALQAVHVGATQFVGLFAEHAEAATVDVAKARLRKQMGEFDQLFQEARAGSADASAATGPAVAGADAAGSDRADALAAIETAAGEYRDSLEKLVGVPVDNVVAAKNALLMLNDAYRRGSDKVSGLVELAAEASHDSLRNGDRLAERNGKILAIGVAASLVLSLLVTWACTRQLTRVLKEGGEIAAALAQGDLTSRAHTEVDDVAGRTIRALSEVSVRLGALVGDVRDAARNVDVAAGEIATGNADLSLRTDQTTSILQDMLVATAALISAIQDCAQSALAANRYSSAAADEAGRSGESMRNLSTSISDIARHSNRIGEITSVIDAISFQTNILALNAAIEAARAGEVGRGFAVVASEVRTLAQRSSAAAREIRQLIDDSRAAVSDGIERAGAAQATIDRVMASIGESSAAVRSVTEALSSESQNANRLSGALQSMQTAAQQNAAMIEQATAATQSLKHQAARLVGSLEVFRIS